MATSTCSIIGCARRTRARGWCIGHYNRWRLTGTPGGADLSRPAGETHHRWSEAPTYYGAHHRITLWRGKASDQKCACGTPADQWAYRHDDPDQLVDERGRPYSTDPDHYDPMCRSCHVRADHARKAAVA